MSKDEHILNCQLAKLLSFDLEDVADVFEPLLDFDSEEDLLEYMCALLGDENDEVVEFVKNIMRFQKGQAIMLTILTKDPCDDAHVQMSENVNTGIVPYNV